MPTGMRSGSAPKLDDYEAVSGETGSSWYGAAAVALAAALFLLRLGARALWASEGRWAEVVREMFLNSNYFWPTINGTLYFDKPLLSYWFIVAASHLTGGLNETAARLPSAIFGVAGVVMIVMLGRRLYDWTTAAWAGFILATSFSYVFFARTASADIETSTGVLAALLLFVWNRRRQDGWWVVWLWLVMAITSLTKGLMGFALPLFILGLYSLLGEGGAVLYERLTAGSLSARWAWLRERMRWFFNLKTPFAMIVAATLYILPFAISQNRAHSDAGLYMVFRENVVRFFEPFDHRGPVYLYLYVIFALMAPWSVFIPAALLEMHRKLRTAADRALADADLFALFYFWCTLIFFTLSRSRRSYYLLPILPAAALVVARLLSGETEEVGAPARRLMNLGYAVLSVAALGLGIAFLMPASMRPGWFSMLPPSPARLIFAAGWVVAAGTIVYAWRRTSVRTIAVSTAVMAYLGMFFLFVVAMPQAEAYRHERSFASAVRSNVSGNSNQLAFFRIWGPGLVYYLAMPHPIPLFNTTEQVAHFAHQRGGAWVITRAKDAQNLKLGSEIRAGEPEDRWDSPSEQGSRYVLLKVD
jgi:4-amino-4-deoxy-L-arabinose transferase-like glycosyltransferase